MSNLAETFYYQIYNSVLLNHKDSAKMYLSFLRDLYGEDSKQFEPLKNDHRWNHLKELGNVIDNDLFVKNFEKIDVATETEVKQSPEVIICKQEQLVKSICKLQDKLRNVLHADSDFHCSSIEAQTMFGRVDLVAQDSATIYPIELKKSTANHDVIGQIDKYILHYKLKLINKIYKNVIGVVIANSFSEYVLQELCRLGAIPIVYLFQDDQIEFKRI